MATVITKEIRVSGGDYDSLSDWEAARGGTTSPDLVNFNEEPLANVYSGAWTSAEPGLVLDAWSTTDDEHRVRISSQAGKANEGVWDATNHRIEATGDGITLGANVRHVSIFGLQVGYNSGNTSGKRGIHLNMNSGSGGYVDLACNICRNMGSTTGGEGIYFRGFGSGFDYIRIYNNLVYGAKEAAGMYVGNCAEPAVFDNTIICDGSPYGLHVEDIGSYGMAEMNLVKGAGKAFQGANLFEYFTGNACDDLSARVDGQKCNRTNQTFTFVDEANHNYNLSASDTGAYRKGFFRSWWVESFNAGERYAWQSIGAFQGPDPDPDGPTVITKIISESNAPYWFSNYDTVVDWEADNGGATGADLTSNDERVVGNILYGCASAEGAITINAWTTDATRNWKLIASPAVHPSRQTSGYPTGQARAGSVWDSGAWRCEGAYFVLDSNYGEIDGLQGKFSTLGFYIDCWSLVAVPLHFTIKNCFAWQDGAGTGTYKCITASGGQSTAGTGLVNIESNVCVGGQDGEWSTGVYLVKSNGRILNNTCVDVPVPFGFSALTSATVTLENNLAEKSTAKSCFAGITTIGSLTVNNNAGNDAIADDAGGRNNRVNQTFSFRNAAGGDYRLAKSDLGALRRGKKVDGIDTDIDGNSIENFSIGACDGYIESECTEVECLIGEAGSGGGFDYDSLGDAEAALFGATGADLQTNDEVVTIRIQDAWTAAESAWVQINCFTTGDMLRRLNIRTEGAARHAGKYTSTAYRIEAGNCLQVTSPFVTIDGIQAAPTASGSYGVYFQNTSQHCDWELLNSIVKGDGVNSRYGIRFYGSSSYLVDALCRQCISYDHKYSTDGSGIVVSGCDPRLEHNICYGNDRGIWASGVLNGDSQNHMLCNICDTNSEYDLYSNGYFTLGDYNVTSDVSAEYFYGVRNNRKSQNPSYVDEGNKDYHLASGDTSSIGFGLDMTEFWPRHGAFDIDGQARTGDWDIGPDQYAAAGTTLTLSGGALAGSIAIGFASLAKSLVGPGIGQSIPAGMVVLSMGIRGKSVDGAVAVAVLNKLCLLRGSAITGAIGRASLAALMRLIGPSVAKSIASGQLSDYAIAPRPILIRTGDPPIQPAPRLDPEEYLKLPAAQWSAQRARQGHRYMSVAVYPTIQDLEHETEMEDLQPAHVLGIAASGDRQMMVFHYHADSEITPDGKIAIKPIYKSGRWIRSS